MIWPRIRVSRRVIVVVIPGFLGWPILAGLALGVLIAVCQSAMWT
jgi:hypothetical protein